MHKDLCNTEVLNIKGAKRHKGSLKLQSHDAASGVRIYMRTEVVLDVSLWAFGGGRSFFIPIFTLFYNTMEKKVT